MRLYETFANNVLVLSSTFFVWHSPFSYLAVQCVASSELTRAHRIRNCVSLCLNFLKPETNLGLSSLRPLPQTVLKLSELVSPLVEPDQRKDNNINPENVQVSFALSAH